MMIHYLSVNVINKLIELSTVDNDRGTKYCDRKNNIIKHEN